MKAHRAHVMEKMQAESLAELVLPPRNCTRTAIPQPANSFVIRSSGPWQTALVRDARAQVPVGRCRGGNVRITQGHPPPLQRPMRAKVKSLNVCSPIKPPSSLSKLSRHHEDQCSARPGASHARVTSTPRAGPRLGPARRSPPPMWPSCRPLAALGPPAPPPPSSPCPAPAMGAWVRSTGARPRARAAPVFRCPWRPHCTKGQRSHHSRTSPAAPKADARREVSAEHSTLKSAAPESFPNKRPPQDDNAAQTSGGRVMRPHHLTGETR